MHTNTRRPRMRVSALTLSVGAVALITVGCGDLAENLVEEGVEQAIEADSGEDVELDFNGEDGFRIETEEGTMTVDEDGNFVIEGADGEVITGETSDDGVTVTDEDGSEVMTIDEDSGQFTVDSEDGSFTAGPGIPEAWPNNVPRPEDLDDVNGSTITGEGELLVSLAGTPSGDASDYFASYESALSDAGFERSSFFESGGVRQGAFESDEFMVNVVTDNDNSTVAVTVTSVNS